MELRESCVLHTVRSGLSEKFAYSLEKDVRENHHEAVLGHRRKYKARKRKLLSLK